MLVNSVPAKLIEPEKGLKSPHINLAKVDFPEPDSPTSPKISPSFISKDTLSTAFR